MWTIVISTIVTNIWLIIFYYELKEKDLHLTGIDNWIMSLKILTRDI